MSLEAARREYLAALDVRSNTRMYYERNLNRLTAMRLRDIAPADINRILDTLGKTSRIQALRTYTAFFSWCIRRHYLDQSPCARMQAETSDSRSRVLSDEELVRIWRACENAVSSNGRTTDFGSANGGSSPSAAVNVPTTFARIVQLLILTGQRRNEIASLKSDYIDFDNKTICLPSSLTKNKREHLFPIGSLSMSILASHSKYADKFLFNARGKTDVPFSGWSKAKTALDRASGVTDWTLHDLRRTFATNMARLGVPLHVIEKLLNHVSGSFGGIVSVYNRNQYMPEMRDAVERYEAWLAKILEQN